MVRGGGDGAEEAGPRRAGREGETERLWLFDEADNAAEDVRLGGGGNGASGFGFVLLFTRLRGGGGGGADSPLYGSQLVFAIGTLRNTITFSQMKSFAYPTASKLPSIAISNIVELFFACISSTRCFGL